MSAAANKDEDASTFAYFSAVERTGETKDLSSVLVEVANSFQKSLLGKYTSTELYPLLKILKDSAAKSKTEDKKNCDTIFCEYLEEVGKITSPAYFSTVARFAILYRECINKYGWIKFAPRMNEEEKGQEKEEYVMANDAEFIPELANEFVLSFLSEHSCILPVIECINLITNFCEWLINKGYTCVKILKK